MTDPRLLVVEDHPEREELIRAFAAPEFRVVVATSAGAAIGILRRDSGRVYSGIVLDHDLQGRRHAEHDQFLSGADVVNAIADDISRDVPILVHSMSATGRAAMSRDLQAAGFSVTIAPLSSLTRESFKEWLEDVSARAADAGGPEE